MSKKIKLATVFFLIAIYCNAIGIVTDSQLYDQNSAKNDTETYFYVVSPGLFSHYSSSDKSFNNLNGPKKLSSSKIHSVQSVFKVNDEVSLYKNYVLHTHFGIYFILNRRRAEIIFPFHHFL